MSDRIKHECGIAMLRLRKPMEYYIEKYGYMELRASEDVPHDGKAA